MKSEVYDMHGVPVCEGDLMKRFHFFGARRKVHYLYHVAVKRGDRLYGVPASHLAGSKNPDDGVFPLDLPWSDMHACEVISGHGPEPYLSFSDRPRRKRESL